ncbi:MAG TPA: trypsin-like peptidase domain-containing protein [Trueperaceae bacterium]|jgi:serine protease Do
MPRALIATLVLAGAALAGAQGLPRDVRLNIVQAVVQIIPYDEEAGTTVGWSGSGTIISPSGYVLTNYHVVGDLSLRRYYEWHAILVTDPAFTDQPPEHYFWARYVAGDPTYDLAVLKIVEWYDEEPIGDDVVFPYVLVGDSNQLIPGDSITIVGYPGISGSTITFTAGLMSGWVGEDFESGGKQWIKTDAKIAHGNSGGGAFDVNGYLIGVPTAGRTVQYEELDVEEQAYVRPISLAWALLGPHVPDVARAPVGNANAGVPPAPGSPATPVAEPPPASVPDGVCNFCIVGAVPLGGTVSGTISGQGQEAINYHTYTVFVPEGTPSLTIELTADFDVDFAIKYGSEIQDWADDGDWAYRDITTANGGTYQVTAPTPGTWYIDVIYAYPSGVAGYSLSAR